MRLQLFQLLILTLLVSGCSPKERQASPPSSPKPAIISKQEPTRAKPDVEPMAPAKLPDLGSDAALPPVRGQLCIKGPGTHDRVGKGSALAAPEKRRGGIISGFIFEVGQASVTVKGKQGGLIEGLALDKRHRVKTSFIAGGSHQSFSFRFEDGSRSKCAYYNSFYDNWRVRELGKRPCGPCSKAD